MSCDDFLCGADPQFTIFDYVRETMALPDDAFDAYPEPQTEPLTLTDDDLGKQFVDREGSVVTLEENDNYKYSGYPYRAKDDDTIVAGRTYTAHGRWAPSGECHPFDLVARAEHIEVLPFKLTPKHDNWEFICRNGRLVTLRYQPTGGSEWPFDILENGEYIDCVDERGLVTAKHTPGDGWDVIRPATEAERPKPDVFAPPTVVDSPLEIAGGQFVTKDSGQRQEFASGMRRDTSAGKMRPDLIKAGPMYLRWVMLLTRGAVKYGPNNWLKAEGEEEKERFLESAQRHFDIWYHWRKYGINLEDPDNPTTDPLTEDHAAAILFNVNGTEYVADKLEA